MQQLSTLYAPLRLVSDLSFYAAVYPVININMIKNTAVLK